MSRPPDALIETLMGPCTREQAAQLCVYDHHYVWVNGRPGVMLTYHWLPLDEAREPLLLKVVFGPPVLRHPPAPKDVQAIVAQLELVNAPSGSREGR